MTHVNIAKVDEIIKKLEVAEVAPQLDEQMKRMEEAISNCSFAEKRRVFGERLTKKLVDSLTAAKGEGDPLSQGEAVKRVRVLKAHKQAAQATGGKVPLGAKTAILKNLIGGGICATCWSCGWRFASEWVHALGMFREHVLSRFPNVAATATKEFQ
jgi:hypothetical protein